MSDTHTPSRPAAWELTNIEKAVLRFEDRAVHDRGYEARIFNQFRLTLTGYGRILHDLLDDPRATAWDAQMLRRLSAPRDHRLPAGPSSVCSRTLGYVRSGGDDDVPPAA
jgi:hypothetical protein